MFPALDLAPIENAHSCSALSLIIAMLCASRKTRVRSCMGTACRKLWPNVGLQTPIITLITIRPNHVCSCSSDIVLHFQTLQLLYENHFTINHGTRAKYKKWQSTNICTAVQNTADCFDLLQHSNKCYELHSLRLWRLFFLNFYLPHSCSI